MPTPPKPTPATPNAPAAPAKAAFSLDQMNDGYGFMGELRGSFYGLGAREAINVFNRACDTLDPKDPERARQFLNAVDGRHMADTMTFDLQQYPSPDEVLAAVKKQAAAPRFQRRYRGFEKYESAAKVVNSLLDEDDEFKTIMDKYAVLPARLKAGVRSAAVQELRSNGFEEIGSSDINHTIVSLFKRVGNFEDIPSEVGMSNLGD